MEYSLDRPVGVEIVRELYAVMDLEWVDKGVIVTTSHFTRGAAAEVMFFTILSRAYLLYHYCTVETYKNILLSKVLWLCDLTDSNDEQESMELLFFFVKKSIKDQSKQTFQSMF